MSVNGWIAFVAMVLFIASLFMIVVRNAPHTQKRLADNGESDWLIDAFVWLNRRTSRRTN